MLCKLTPYWLYVMLIANYNWNNCVLWGCEIPTNNCVLYKGVQRITRKNMSLVPCTCCFIIYIEGRFVLIQTWNLIIINIIWML